MSIDTLAVPSATAVRTTVLVLNLPTLEIHVQVTRNTFVQRGDISYSILSKGYEGAQGNSRDARSEGLEEEVTHVLPFKVDSRV